MSFEFKTVNGIKFGRGIFDSVGKIMSEYGDNYLVVINKGFESSPIMSRLKLQANTQGIKINVYDDISGEPEPYTIDKALEYALLNNCNAVLGLGGGTAIDTAKAVAGLITTGGPVIDYLEGVGTGRVLNNDTAPFIAVPLTSGTGAEVTKNAVISSKELGYKKSFRSDKLLAKVALIDPELTIGLSQKRTAWSGMDALTQLIESYVSKKSNPITDALAERGMSAAAYSLIAAYTDGTNLAAREGMCFASLLSGICLANSGLGAAHGFAAGLGAILGVPHGLACAILLPHVMEMNMTSSIGKYGQIGRILTGEKNLDDETAAIAGVETIKKINAMINIMPNLKYLEITENDLNKIIEASFGSSMSGNPLFMDKDGCFRFMEKII